VVGTVVANDTLQPIAGATVRDTTYGSGSATTAADGTFAVSFAPRNADNSAFTLVLQASASGFNPLSKTVTLFCGAQLVVDFAPPPPGYGTVTGTVRDASGGVVGKLFVGSSWGSATTTADDGTYTLTGAPSNPDGSARTWSVSAVPPSSNLADLPATVSVSVAAGQTVTADLTLGTRDAGPPPNRAPVAVISPAAPSTPEGTAVTLSATSSSDADDDALTYAWDVNGDGVDDGTSSTLTVTPPHPPSVSQTCTVTVNVPVEAKVCERSNVLA
jgi:hypothetical protein